jgi:hypothetical protein
MSPIDLLKVTQQVAGVKMWHAISNLMQDGLTS